MKQYVVLKVSNAFDMNVSMAQWLSWLERRPVTAEVTGSSPVWVVSFKRNYNFICWYGGIGRRKGLKIPRGQLRAGSSPATSTFL